jgi:hypothetical protein
MNKTKVPEAPSPSTKTIKPGAKPVRDANYRKEFFLAATNMSWQLAVVVLVPIIGGFELDKTLDTLPALTIAGFFVAMAGMGVVVWRQLQLFSPTATGSGHHKGAHQ